MTIKGRSCSNMVIFNQSYPTKSMLFLKVITGITAINAINRIKRTTFVLKSVQCAVVLTNTMNCFKRLKTTSYGSLVGHAIVIFTRWIVSTNIRKTVSVRKFGNA